MLCVVNVCSGASSTPILFSTWYVESFLSFEYRVQCSSILKAGRACSPYLKLDIHRGRNKISQSVYPKICGILLVFLEYGLMLFSAKMCSGMDDLGEARLLRHARSHIFQFIFVGLIVLMALCTGWPKRPDGIFWRLTATKELEPFWKFESSSTPHKFFLVCM